MRIVRISDYIKDIKPFYYISDDGKVYSNNKLLKPYIDYGGYCKVTLATLSGKFKHYFVHFLVNYVFNGKPNSLINDPVTDHINGIRNDNRYENLRWLSNQDNRSYNYRHNGNKSDIDDLALKDIFDMYNEGFTTGKIGKKYNVSGTYIYEILSFRKRRDDSERLSLTPISVNHKPRIYSNLTKNDILDIFNLFNSGISCNDIANKYNISVAYTRDILRGRAKLKEIHELKLEPVKETHISSKIINKIIYDILYLNKTDDEIISKYNVTKNFIIDLKYNHSCKEYTKNIDFKQNSKTVLFDPRFEISTFEEFDILNDIYNQYDFLSQSEEIDLFSSNEIKIGDTEYLF